MFDYDVVLSAIVFFIAVALIMLLNWVWNQLQDGVDRYRQNKYRLKRTKYKEKSLHEIYSAEEITGTKNVEDDSKH